MKRGKSVLVLFGVFVCLIMLGFETAPALATEPTLDWFIELPGATTVYSNFWVSHLALGPAEGALYAAVSVTDEFPATDHQLTVKYNRFGINNPWGLPAWVADYGQRLWKVSIAVDASGNAVVAGHYEDEDELPWSVLVKYDSDGNQLWDVVSEGGFMAYGDNLPNPVAVDASGNVYARGAGNTVTKYDGGDGSQLWASPFGDGDGSEFEYIAVDPSDSVYVLGTDNGDLLTVKYDPTGAQLWAAPFDVPEIGYVFPISLVLHGSAVHVAANTWDETTGILDCLTLKYDEAGSELWNAHFTETQAENTWYGGYGNASSLLQVDASGNVHVAPPGFWDHGYVVVKYDSAGNELWVTSIPSGDHTGVSGMGLDAQGNVYLTGCAPEAVSYPVMTFKFDPEGSLVWDTQFGILPGNIPYSMVVTSRGYVYVLGASGPIFVPDLPMPWPVFGFLIRYVEEEPSSSPCSVATPVEAGTGPADTISTWSSTVLSWLPPLIIPFFVLFALRSRRKKVAPH